MSAPTHARAQTTAGVVRGMARDVVLEASALARGSLEAVFLAGSASPRPHTVLPRSWLQVAARFKLHKINSTAENGTVINELLLMNDNSHNSNETDVHVSACRKVHP